MGQVIYLFYANALPNTTNARVYEIPGPILNSYKSRISNILKSISFQRIFVEIAYTRPLELRAVWHHTLGMIHGRVAFRILTSNRSFSSACVGSVERLNLRSSINIMSLSSIYALVYYPCTFIGHVLHNSYGRRHTATIIPRVRTTVYQYHTGRQ